MRNADRVFILIIALILVTGIFVFASASLGILAKNKEIFYSIVTNQFLFGLCGGITAFFVFSRVHFSFWRRWALPIVFLALAITALVFVPGIGFSHAGAARWIDLAGISFQPSEFLKFGLIAYTAAWISLSRRGYVSNSILIMLFAGTTVVMLKQPDTGTFMVMALAIFSIFIAAGVSWKKILLACLLGIVGLSALVYSRPYLKDRIITFINPNYDPKGSSYQIQQSLIAIGSGGLTGRGLGQSVQKFSYLPEPVGDSIFAVIGEELGFIGGAAIVVLFVLLGLRGLKIAGLAEDQFGNYLAVGLITMIVGQSFLNIASLLGIFPLTGVPLVFISHGGTALLFALAEAGVIANISRFTRRR